MRVRGRRSEVLPPVGHRDADVSSVLPTVPYREVRGPGWLIKNKRSKVWHCHVTGGATACGVCIERRDAEFIPEATYVRALRLEALDGERDCARCFE